MPRYIDADKALEDFDEWCDTTGALGKGTSYYYEARSCIEDVPTADAVEVVRCKDCVNMGKRPPLPKGYREDCGWCVMNGHAVLPEDFCSNGETADEKDRRDAAEQDAYEQLCNLGNPEDGSL